MEVNKIVTSFIAQKLYKALQNSHEFSFKAILVQISRNLPKFSHCVSLNVSVYECVSNDEIKNNRLVVLNG